MSDVTRFDEVLIERAAHGFRATCTWHEQLPGDVPREWFVWGNGRTKEQALAEALANYNRGRVATDAQSPRHYKRLQRRWLAARREREMEAEVFDRIRDAEAAGSGMIADAESLRELTTEELRNVAVACVLEANRAVLVLSHQVAVLAEAMGLTDEEWGELNDYLAHERGI